MNDTELDEILDQWSVPPAPASLRESVQAGYIVEVQRKAHPGARLRWIAALLPSARKSQFAGTMVGVGALLFLVAQALPQISPPARIPYTVDSEFIRYAEDGSPTVEMYITSYANQNGAEALLSRSIPGHPLGSMLGRTLDATLPLWSRLMLTFTVSSSDLEMMKRLRGRTVGGIAGCADWTCLVLSHYGFRRAATGAGAGCLDGPVVGRETILNYPTTAVERTWFDGQRMTLWTAPDLGCLALRIATEKQRPDGTFHLVTVKQALKVTLNP